MITFTLREGAKPSAGGDDGTLYQFFSPRKDDIANLIASYSPEHRNWKQSGLTGGSPDGAAPVVAAEAVPM